MASRTFTLTDDEGTFLALVARVERATAYQLSKIYSASPVSNFGTSKGKIYPLIRRLEERKLLAKRRVSGDARGTEQLECTAAGRRALRQWVRQVKPAHVLLEDPLRTKIQSFDLLTREEQIEWLVDVKQLLQDKLAELEAYERSVWVPFKEYVHDNAVSSVRCRMEWLDRMLRDVVKGVPAVAASDGRIGQAPDKPRRRASPARK